MARHDGNQRLREINAERGGRADLAPLLTGLRSGKPERRVDGRKATMMPKARSHAVSPTRDALHELEATVKAAFAVLARIPAVSEMGWLRSGERSAIGSMQPQDGNGRPLPNAQQITLAERVMDAIVKLPDVDTRRLVAGRALKNTWPELAAKLGKSPTTLKRDHRQALVTLWYYGLR